MAYMVIKSNDGVPEARKKSEILIDSTSDLADLSDEFAPGSVAYTASLDAMYMKAIDGTWKKMGG